jgi:hypothetical protein
VRLGVVTVIGVITRPVTTVIVAGAATVIVAI